MRRILPTSLILDEPVYRSVKRREASYWNGSRPLYSAGHGNTMTGCDGCCGSLIVLISLWRCPYSLAKGDGGAEVGKPMDWNHYRLASVWTWGGLVTYYVPFLSIWPATRCMWGA